MASADNKKKKSGFGIGVETRGASSAKFKLDANINDGLSIGALKEVTVTTADYGENQKGDFAEFAGKTVPMINFIFGGIVAKAGDPEPIYVQSFKPMPIIPGKYGWFYDSMFQTIRHFIDVYTGNGFTEDHAKLLGLDIDPDESMEFEALVAAYEAFFKGVATVFNGDGKEMPCIFNDAKGNGRAIWMKLLLYYNGRDVNNANPGFSGFPGDGLIELAVDGITPSMRIAIEKGESIIPVAKGSNKPAVPGGGTTSGGASPTAAAQGGSSVPDFMK